MTAKVPNPRQVLILRDELQGLWQGKDVFAEVRQLQGDIARAVPGRETRRFELNGKVYYRKLHTGVGWGEIVKDLIRLRLPVIGARNEWLALNRLQELGVPSLVPVAFGEQYTNPARRLSFIVTRELTGTVQLDDYLCGRVRENALGFCEKRMLLCQVAQVASTIHLHGINHRDLYLCHFLLDQESMQAWQQGGEPPVLYLVDLHRAQLRARVPRRWLVKDVASIYFSAMALGLLTRGDIYRFLRAYFKTPLKDIFQQRHSLLQQIERRAAKLYQREQRLKARGLRD
jgi:hypothetical protein